MRATIHTTLTTSAGQIRQFAFDGDPNTFFASVEKPGLADHFTLIFDEAVAVGSIEVITGRSDGSDSLNAGEVEISADGRAFGDPSKFVDGNARLELSGKPVRAVRIKPAKDLNHPLTIREIKITSDPPVATFQYPVEFIVDVSDAPEMKAWAEHVAEVCERSYPMINEELKSDGYKPPVLVTMSLKKSYRGVAAAGGSHITGSVDLLQEPSRRRRGDGPRDGPRRATLSRPEQSGMACRGSGRLRAVFQVRARQDRTDQSEPGPLQRQLPSHGCILELLDRKIRQADRAQAQSDHAGREISRRRIPGVDW